MTQKKAFEYRDKPEVLDRFVGTIGLVLICFLMVSLAFFILARISLSTKWASEHWILFWEVFGTVLISRMFLIDDLKKVVGGYAFVLGMFIWVPFAGIALMDGEIKMGTVFTILIMFIGWFTYKITWDVTDLGEREEDEDGLLASVGLKKELNPGNKKASESWGDTREESTEFNFEAEEVLANLHEEKPKKIKGGKGRGVWVLYFLFGSIPIFGFGGSTQNSDDPNLGKYFLFYLGVYLTSCIALLMVTSFLTIRTDLRRRNLTMPLFTAGFWLFSGLFVLAGCFIFASLLPRPQGFLDPIALVFSGKQDREASNYAKSSEKAGKGNGNPGEKESDKGVPKEGKKKAGDPSRDKSNNDSSKKSGNDESNSSEKGSEKSSSTEAKQKVDSGKNNESKGGKKAESSDDQKSDGTSKSNSSPNNQPPSFDIPGLDKLMAALAVFLKIFFAVGTFLFVLYVVVYKLSFYSDWADDFLGWLRNLLAWVDPSKINKKQEDDLSASTHEDDLPFDQFDNPFDHKDWQKSSLRELTGYTWKALLAWCKAQNIPIPKGCTPSELEEIISNEMPRIEPAYFAFKQVLLNVQYSNITNDPKGVATTQNLWRLMIGDTNTAGVGSED